MTICSSFCSLVILVLINLLASKVFSTSAPLVLTSKSTLSNKMEKLSNSRFGPQQVKSVSERSPAFTTEELIRDYGVGKSWLLLRFATILIQDHTSTEHLSNSLRRSHV
ncbi:uncharacterized protein LOC106375770 isoform X3 [Brassica napus]|uniref:uncharacterized protein LOC106375770 isoform X3 n=1 Tax=Brassica napus TaxID=3708 RepID=UPI002078D507|nr:uncharacterized protein LOC106375770 isoform X3 [Brassica napus]